jgi:hypothetical protein
MVGATGLSLNRLLPPWGSDKRLSDQGRHCWQAALGGGKMLESNALGGATGSIRIRSDCGDGTTGRATANFWRAR